MPQCRENIKSLGKDKEASVMEVVTFTVAFCNHVIAFVDINLFIVNSTSWGLNYHTPVFQSDKKEGLGTKSLCSFKYFPRTY